MIGSGKEFPLQSPGNALEIPPCACYWWIVLLLLVGRAGGSLGVSPIWVGLVLVGACGFLGLLLGVTF